MHVVTALADFHGCPGDERGRRYSWAVGVLLPPGREGGRNRGPPKGGQQPYLPCAAQELTGRALLIERAACSRLQVPVRLQLDFLTDGQFNEPIY